MKGAEITFTLLITLFLFSFQESAPDHGDTMLDNTEQPLFPGCEYAPESERKECSRKLMFDYVASKLIYPEELRQAKIEGIVHVKFVVGTNGFISKGWIDRALHPRADQAALDVVNSMNKDVGKWTPGREGGKIVSMEVLLPVRFSLEENEKDNVYQFAEVKPRFPGCEDLPEVKRVGCAIEKLNKFIYERIRYPQADRENGNQGIVIAKFVVNADGSISDAKIINGVSPGIDAEVLRIINSMNELPERWTPGYNYGIPVAAEFSLPVKFIIQKVQKE